MSATLFATTSTTTQAIAEWARLFPRQVTETYTSSVTFMKQLTVVAVSTITYMKNMFPHESYTVETFGGVKLRILKKKCRDELAQFVSTALTQAFEAFDKRYLHQLALCFYDGDCHVDNLIEYHVFEFTYTSDGVTLDLHSTTRDNVKQSTRYAFDNIKERTMLLIQACMVVMQASQDKRPAFYDVSLRLYYNEDAPEDYQAPGFRASSAAEEHLAGPRDAALLLGHVETPFHRLVAHSYTRDDMGSSHEANASQNVPVMTQNEGEELCSNSERESKQTSVGRAPLRCPCNNYNWNDDTFALLTCNYCNTMQHAACFGVTKEQAARLAQHCCTHCSDEDATRTPTDTNLAQTAKKSRECLCLFRQVMEWGQSKAGVCARSLAARFVIAPLTTVKLMKLLLSQGILHHNAADEDDFVSPRKINHEQLKCVMRKHFQSKKMNITDRLLAETNTRGGPTDPVGDVLGPLEKVNLQNATALGIVVEHTLPDIPLEDYTLKQYKEALLSSDQKMDEHLPLSGSHNPVKDMENIGKNTTKRKMDEQETRQLRSGVKSKRAKALPK